MKALLTPISILVGLALSLIPTIASAQFSSNEGGDPFKRASTGDTGGLLQLINQAQLNSKVNPNYAIQQQEQITSATDDFRARQLQVLRDLKKTTPAPVVATPK